MKKDLKRASEAFRSRYDLLPAFKSGIRFGEMITGLIGVVKKEILYTGDVLNVTVRIQDLCNTHNEELLVSGDLMAKVPGNGNYHFNSIGEISLTGRHEHMAAWSVREV